MMRKAHHLDMSLVRKNRVAEVRKAVGIKSTKRLAEMAGLDRGALWRIERHEQSLDEQKTYLLSEALGVHPGELYAPMPFDEMPETAEVVKIATALRERDAAAFNEWLAISRRYRTALGLDVSKGPVAKPGD